MGALASVVSHVRSLVCWFVGWLGRGAHYKVSHLRAKEMMQTRALGKACHGFWLQISVPRLLPEQTNMEREGGSSKNDGL